MAKARASLSRIYAALAVAGAILPYTIFIPWLTANGLDVRLFVSQLFGSGPASIFALDALLSAGIFIIFMIAEGRRLGMRYLWLPPVAVFVFGLCCGFPLFLAMRERAMAKPS